MRLRLETISGIGALAFLWFSFPCQASLNPQGDAGEEAPPPAACADRDGEACCATYRERELCLAIPGCSWQRAWGDGFPGYPRNVRRGSCVSADPMSGGRHPDLPRDPADEVL